MLIGLVTVSIGEPSPGLADLRISRAAPLKWGISVIESGEIPVILTI